MLTYISTVLPSTTGSDDGIHVVMAGYNRTRYVEELLERTDALPPSFTVHLHLEYWTLNNGSKFLYNNQIAVRVSCRPLCLELTDVYSRCLMIYGHTGYQWTFLSCSKQLGCLFMRVRPGTAPIFTVTLTM